jgi:hypothetical protein
MAYNTVTFVAFEQPTAAKMNLLGENDAGFRDGTNISNDVIQARHIDWATTGANGGIWGEELGRTTLGVAGDTISVNSIASRKYLEIFLMVWSTGGTIAPVLRFNNDSSANYAFHYLANWTTASNNVSQSYMDGAATIAQGTQFIHGYIVNVQNKRKLCQITAVDDNNAAATSGSNSHHIVGKWDNTAAQITRIDAVNIGAGDFAIGSELVVLGHD